MLNRSALKRAGGFADKKLEHQFREYFGMRWAETRANLMVFSGAATITSFTVSRLLAWPWKCSMYIGTSGCSYVAWGLVATIGHARGWRLGFHGSQLFNGTAALCGAVLLSLAFSEFAHPVTRVTVLAGWYATKAFGAALTSWTYRMLFRQYVVFLLAWSVCFLAVFRMRGLTGTTEEESNA
eukprot:g7697.t1